MTELTREADREKWLTLKYAVLEKNLQIVFQEFRAKRIEPILIKGWAASLVYPERWQRYSSDIDLAVAPEDYVESLRIAESIPQITIDIHKGLRRLDTLEWEKLFENSRLVEIEKIKIRILSEEDHLRVLAVHWLQDGGAYKNKLWDIFYAVANRSKSFDWEKCLGAVNQKRRLWIVYTIGLAHKYLNLDLENFPFRKEAQNLPKWIGRTLVKEWDSETRLIPLENSIADKTALFKQIRKRFHPNSVQATIDMEGFFEKYPRIYYQIGSFWKRLSIMIVRLIKKQ